MRLARVRLTWVRLPLVRLLTWTGPILPGYRPGRLPGPGVPDALAELALGELALGELALGELALPLVGRPAGSRLRSGGLPGTRVAGTWPAAWPAARSRCPALSLLGSRGLPGASNPRVGAVPGARRLPAACRAGASAARCLPRGPVWARRGIRGLPGSGTSHVRTERSPASRPVRSLLRPGGLPGAGAPRVLAELAGHLRAARLSGAVRVGVAVRPDIRHLTGRRAVRPGAWRLTLAERILTELTLAGRPWPLVLTELTLAGLLPGSELTLPVAGWSLLRFSPPVSGLSRRPRLFVTVGILLWPRSLAGTRPARAGLAWPGRPGGVLSRTALGLTLGGRHGTRRTGPLLSGLVSRLLPAASRSRWPPGRGAALRRSRPALCGPGVGPGLPGEVLSLIPRFLRISGRLRRRTSRTLTWSRCVRVGPRPLRVVGPRRARPAWWCRARLARTLLARGSLPGAGAGRTCPRAANARHRVLWTLPG